MLTRSGTGFCAGLSYTRKMPARRIACAAQGFWHRVLAKSVNNRNGHRVSNTLCSSPQAHLGMRRALNLEHIGLRKHEKVRTLDAIRFQVLKPSPLCETLKYLKPCIQGQQSEPRKRHTPWRLIWTQVKLTERAQRAFQAAVEPPTSP